MTNVMNDVTKLWIVIGVIVAIWLIATFAIATFTNPQKEPYSVILNNTIIVESGSNSLPLVTEKVIEKEKTGGKEQNVIIYRNGTAQ